MMQRQRFHDRLPTDTCLEIALAESLRTTLCLRYGGFKLPRMLRTDPGMIFGKLLYGRVSRSQDNAGNCCEFQNNYFEVIEGWPLGLENRATNDDILTPSHSDWGEFEERLRGHLLAPDFDDHFGAARMIQYEEITTEYWPLCSAMLIRDLGFAIAESLALMNSFLGSDDERISRHVRSLWHKTKPSKHRRAFDDVEINSRINEQHEK